MDGNSLESGVKRGDVQPLGPSLGRREGAEQPCLGVEMCSPRGLTWLGVSGSAEAFTEDARQPGRWSRLGDRGGGLWTNFEGSRCGAGPASRACLGFGPGTAASGGSESPQRTGASVSRLGVGRMLVCGKQGRSSGLGCLSEVSSQRRPGKRALASAFQQENKRAPGI